MCLATHEERVFVVFIVYQNLLGIGAVVSIVCLFLRFHEFGLKMPIHAHF